MVIGLGLTVLGAGNRPMPALSATANPVIAVGDVAQAHSSSLQQGIDQYQAGQFTEAIAQWQQALSQARTVSSKMLLHSNLAQAYRQLGQLDRAIDHWRQAIGLYQVQASGADQQELGAHWLAQALTEQAQIYNDLGQHQQAIVLLEQAIARTRPDLESGNLASDTARRTAAAAYGVLSNAHWARGDYDTALTTSQTGLNLARQLNDPSFLTTALNNRGNVFASRVQRYRYQANTATLEGDDAEADRLNQLAKRDLATALSLYQESVQVSQRLGNMAEVKTLLNFNRVLERDPQPDPNSVSPTLSLIRTNQTRILRLLDNLPNSQDKTYALINLASSLLQSAQPADPAPLTLLNQALTIARAIGDRRSESFALGSLGQLYEAQQQTAPALQYTRQALFAAQSAQAPDSLYRWQWQLGRLLRLQGDLSAAITAYETAISTLQSIRGDIVIANRDLQFDFRDAVEPVYRELIDLLLTPSLSAPTASLTGVAAVPPQNIRRVLDILELFKLAELQNFFGDDCVQIAQANVVGAGGLIDPEAAVVYSIVLGDRTELILRLPDGRLENYPIRLTDASLQTEIDTLRTLMEKRATDEYLPQSQVVYNLLIRPLEAALAAAKPKTLVFIHDGVLRKIPMAALHNGQQFLVEQYAIATTPSLNLTTRQPRSQQHPKALIVGLTVEQPPFAALPNVSAEVNEIQKILGGSELVDTAFTPTAMAQRLRQSDYGIIHMATHGKFGPDAFNTFLVAYQSRITITELDSILRLRPTAQLIELLTLSACQTAAGDTRATLGIAGVAVRAGVKSALATLWFINDQSTVPLIKEFYTQLNNAQITKAEALRQAQLKLIQDRDYNHPAVWAPFILIGNWL